MGLSKLAIGLIAGIGSVAAIGGITAGVLVSKQNTTQMIDSSSEEKPQSDQITNTDTKPSLDEITNSINEQSIYLVDDKQNKKASTDFYAFNVEDSNLMLDSKLLERSDFSANLSINKKANSIDKLNNGILNINVQITSKTNQNQTLKTIPLVINGFKKGEQSLKNIFDAVKETDPIKTDNKYSLTITPKSGNENKFVSLEDLNKQEGLTNWLKQSTLDATVLSGISIKGEVKLEKIEQFETKSYFVLHSAKENEYLKLIKKDQTKSLEILISQIKTTNLLASEIKVVPVEVDENNKQYVNELTSTQTSSSSYSKDEKGIYLNIAKEKTPEEKVYLNPYLITKPIAESKNTIPVNVVISFGSGENKKSFSTADEMQNKQLKSASFTFNVYAKRLDNDKDKKLSADKITNQANKLETYFKQANYTTPSEKKHEVSMVKKVDGDFYVNHYKLEDTKKPLEVKFGDGSSNGANDVMAKQKSENQNFLLFADYSYKTTLDTDSLNEKVLYLPSLSLIHLSMIKA